MAGDSPLNIPGGSNSSFFPSGRLFPLPNFVLFPHVVRALHIFEPRYCAMLERALATDNMITMSTLCPGWESTYQDSPAIQPIVCIGKIIHHEPTADGRHNILLQGRTRARVIRELEMVELFRVAELETIDDILASDSDSVASSDCIARSLDRIFRCILTCFSGIPLAALMQQQSLSETTINAISYVIAGLLPLNLDFQLKLLTETCPRRRLSLIEQWLSDTTGYPFKDDVTPTPDSPPKTTSFRDDDFPPSFSLN